MTGEERTTILINITKILRNERTIIAEQQSRIENLETNLAAAVFVTQEVFGQKKYEDARHNLEPTVKKSASIQKDMEDIDRLLDILNKDLAAQKSK
jgi:hypothetical protein